jgi:hypothetical protein
MMREGGDRFKPSFPVTSAPSSATLLPIPDPEVSMGRAPQPSAVLPLTNYRLYRAREVPRTYLVVSTYFDHEGRPEVPNPAAFEERGAMQALFADLESAAGAPAPVATPAPAGSRRRRARVTLRTHGFNTRLGDFARDLLHEAAAGPGESFRPGRRVLVGYRWPSEGVLSRRSVYDTSRALFFTAVVSVALLLLPAGALLPPAHHWLAGGETGPIAAALRPLFWPYASRVLAGFLLGAGTLLLALRLSTYLRDRYRALHYGVPDLCEFVRDLQTGLEATGLRVALDLVGHSMGCLMLVNAVRLMSEFFHRPGAESRFLGDGRSIELRTLVLAAPDIPAALASPERNNYFLSSLRRFAAVHVLSSDRDIVLKWASTLGNWASEPRHDMAGRHLGNAFLARAGSVPGAGAGTPHTGAYLPALRPQVRAFPVLEPQPPPAPPARLAWVHFHDCSVCPSLAGGAGRPVALSLVALVVLAGLHLWLGHAATLWALMWAAILLGLGALARFVPGWRDWWRLGPFIGALADWPALAGFGRSTNPHGGYFVPGSEPRRLIARVLRGPARPSAAGQTPALVRAGKRIRTSAVALEV